LHFLIKMDPGAIELSEKMYRILSPLPEYPSYILRMENPADAKKYPHITEFVCRNVPASAPIDARERIRAEILLDNTLKTSSETTARYAGYTNVRVQGLDNLMCDDYMRAFEYLKKSFNGGAGGGMDNKRHGNPYRDFLWRHRRFCADRRINHDPEGIPPAR
jgi:homocitrate synthase NifV